MFVLCVSASLASSPTNLLWGASSYKEPTYEHALVSPLDALTRTQRSDDAECALGLGDTSLVGILAPSLPTLARLTKHNVMTVAEAPTSTR